MGYTHYWIRERSISKPVFKRIVDDFKRLLPIFKILDVKLGDGLGEGEPIINYNEVTFNGLRNCGHPKNSHVVVPWPAVAVKPGVAPNSNQAVVGSWFAGVVLNQRTCNGDCSYETFYFPRVLPESDCAISPSDPLAQRNPKYVGKVFQFCKTAFRPYDLAVTAFLVIAKHHLRDELFVRSDGEIVHWLDAAKLCQDVLGYGLDFKLDR